MDSTFGLTEGRGVECRVRLARLLLRANDFVSTDEIVEWLWDGSPPSLDLPRFRAHLHTVRPAPPQ